MLLRLACPGSTAHADILNGTAEAGHFMSLKMGQRNKYICIHDCPADLCILYIFAADHGERIFDNSTEWGRNLTWDRNDIIQQFDIPFWIWASPSYRSSRAQQWEQIRSCRNRRGMTDTIAQLLLHLAGIHSPWYYPQYDILHNDYDNSRKRIIRGERDYDRIMLAP